MKKLILLSFLTSIIFSCRTQKDVLYFQNIDSVIGETPEIYNDPKIQTGDALTINVKTFNQELAEPFNLGSGTRTTSTQNLDERSPLVYIVSGNGEIEMPMLGSINVVGKTRQELSAYLEGKISTYVNNPIVNVRIINFEVTMLGEFNRPGVVSARGDKLNIMEAIAQSGDMTLYSIRDSVMLIRTENGIRTQAFINLKDANLINSPYFYLRQNDIIYAMPSQAKALEFNTKPINAALTAIGFVLTIYAIFK